MLMLLKFTAGLALLLFGMQFMKTGLENTAQKQLARALQALTKTPLTGTLTGIALTMLVQSSTAVTVLTIGFVNARVMNFAQAVGIIMGTNVGTSITAQIIAFDLEKLAIPAIGLGAIIMTLSTKKRSLRSLGQAIIGFGTVFMGMSIMAEALKPLKDYPGLVDFLSSLSHNPFLAVLAGTLFTALIHSSSTTAGVVMTLSHQGLIDLPAAVAIVFGSNIGTCITAVLAAIGSSLAAKRVAASHVLLNVIGVFAILPFLGPFSSLIAMTAPGLPRQIANAHTIFNIASTLVVLPFTKHFVALVEKVVPGKSL